MHQPLNQLNVSVRDRMAALFLEHAQQKNYAQTDKLFAVLMILQWLAGIAAAVWISPQTWIGASGQTHWHVWAAIFLGGTIAGFPVFLALKFPGKPETRETIAVSQMLFSTLLIHLTGGRLETHFHVFGSLAFLAMYRDWRVLAMATVVVAADHFFRGVFWPQSVFGVVAASPWRWVEHAGWVVFEDIFLFISIQQNVHEMSEVARKQAELECLNADIEKQVAARTQELTAEQELLRSLMNSLPDAIYFKDTQSRFTRINPALANFFGLANPEAAVGKTDADFQQGAAAQQKMADEQSIFATGQPILNLLEKSCVGDKSSWVSTTKVPLRDAQGKITGLVGISRDVTTQMQSETQQRLLEVQLYEARKLEAVGQLAAGIAHEINTPIQYIGDNTRFAQESVATIFKVLRSHEELLAAAKKSALTPEVIAPAEQLVAASDLNYLYAQVPAAIKESLDGVERVATIVRAMKEFSHPGGKEKIAADLNRAIESTVTVARNEWKFMADVKMDLSPDLPHVSCFLGEFNQCILNLVVNASHAIGDVVKKNPGTKGIITVQTRRDNDHVVVRVTDTGTGIPEKVRPHIFEPFYTTKDVGKGTGQGLAITYGSIVNKHGGTVSFETEMGRGTTFILRLPILPRSAESAAKNQEVNVSLSK